MNPAPHTPRRTAPSPRRCSSWPPAATAARRLVVLYSPTAATSSPSMEKELARPHPEMSTSAGSTWARRRSTTAFAPKPPTRRPTSGSAASPQTTFALARHPRVSSPPQAARSGPKRCRPESRNADNLYFGSYWPPRCWSTTTPRSPSEEAPARTGTTCSIRSGREDRDPRPARQRASTQPSGRTRLPTITAVVQDEQAEAAEVAQHHAARLPPISLPRPRSSSV